ncbi:uncharacterized protein LOC143301307 [Babylonia areolata]|uniref:uncharacterized protein LOC143301307 n=1 Tax=Babylonia areolata TaxID=304850 RepID=UPI003FCF4938
MARRRLSDQFVRWVVVTLGLMVPSVAGPGGSNQWDEFTDGTGCFRVSSETVESDDADCKAGYKLTWFDSVQQMEGLANVQPRATLFVGVERDSGQYVWIKTGDEVPVDLWSGGAVPFHNPDKECVVLLKSTRRLDLEDCSTVHYYVCRRDHHNCGNGFTTFSHTVPTTTVPPPETTTIPAAEVTTAPPPAVPQTTDDATTTIVTTQTSPDDVTAAEAPQTTPLQGSPSSAASQTAAAADSTTATASASAVVPQETTSSSPSAQPDASSAAQPATSSPTVAPTMIPMNPCSCNCRLQSRQANVSSQELSAMVDRIKSQLQVETSNLSASVRKKTSAPDERTSAKVTGSVGIGILVFIGVIPLALDLDRVIAAVSSWLGRRDDDGGVRREEEKEEEENSDVKREEDDDVIREEDDVDTPEERGR